MVPAAESGELRATAVECSSRNGFMITRERPLRFDPLDVFGFFVEIPEFPGGVIIRAETVKSFDAV